MSIIPLSRRKSSEGTVYCGACALALSLFLPVTASAQSDWTYHPAFEATDDRFLAYDEARSVTVMVGGNPGHSFVTTREWDGTTWTLRPTANVPRARKQGAMAYQRGIGKMLLFGGFEDDQTPLLDETWEYDGVDWVERRPANAPSARVDAAMAWDAGRNRMVLFGGEANRTFLADTWEWDGINWQQMQPATVPPQVAADAEMCFDESTQRIFMVMTDHGVVNQMRETWEWDGVNWTRLLVEPIATSYQSIGLVYDPIVGRPVLLAEQPSGVAPQTVVYTWAVLGWASATYPRLSTLRRPIRCRPAFDRARGALVMFDGPESATWEFSGGAWQLRNRHTAIPLAGQVAGYDPVRQTVVLLVARPGAMQHWESNAAGGWTLRFEQRGSYPLPLTSSVLAFDEGRQQLLLVAGGAEVWSLSGSTWLPLTVPGIQTPLIDYQVAWDGQQFVLFGGFVFAGSNRRYLDDTWVWNGAWRRVFTSNRPIARGGALMVEDPRRNRVVLFGGSAGNDTWEWDGLDWQRMLPQTSPLGHAFGVYDSVRERVVLIGNRREARGWSLNDCWEWDGVDWTQIATGRFVSFWEVTGVGAFDESRGEVRIFGGTPSEQWQHRFFDRLNSNDTWTLRTRDPAVVDGFGRGCTGGMGVPELRTQADSKPWFGDNFGLVVDNMASGASAVVLLGLSNTTWGNTPLPVDLGLVGAAGCDLLVEPSAVIALAGPGPSVSLTIPRAPVLLGVQFFTQGLVFDPGAPNAAGLAVSNGLALTLGRR